MTKELKIWLAIAAMFAIGLPFMLAGCSSTPPTRTQSALRESVLPISNSMDRTHLKPAVAVDMPPEPPSITKSAQISFALVVPPKPIVATNWFHYSPGMDTTKDIWGIRWKPTPDSPWSVVWLNGDRDGAGLATVTNKQGMFEAFGSARK